MAKRRKRHKKSAGGWSASKLSKYRRLKRKLIQMVDRGGTVTVHHKA